MPKLKKFKEQKVSVPRACVLYKLRGQRIWLSMQKHWASIEKICSPKTRPCSDTLYHLLYILTCIYRYNLIDTCIIIEIHIQSYIGFYHMNTCIIIFIDMCVIHVDTSIC